MKRILLTATLLLCCIISFAQVPQAINYQAIARDAQGEILSDKGLSIKLAILQGDANGTVVYEETHQTTSGKNGVINIQIGKGSPRIGSFAYIDWSQSPYFIRFSMDENGGSNFKEMATTQMLSVPYALYAEKAGNTANHMFIVTTDGHSDRLFTGAMVEDYEPEFRCLVSYLDMEDQDVKVSFEGVPSGASVEDRSLASGPYGRYIDMRIIYSPEGTHSVAVVMTNKYGITKRFPFKYQRGSINITPTPDADEETVREAKKQLLTAYVEFSLLNKNIDNAFMNQSAETSYIEFKSKTYSSSSYTISNFWNKAYALIAKANTMLYHLDTNLNVSYETRKSAIEQAKITRAYAHLMLTQWFGDVPLILKKFEQGDNLYVPRTPQPEVLEAIISDLRSVCIITKSLSNNPDETDITIQEAEIMLREAYLLKKEWKNAIDLEQQGVELESLPLKSSNTINFIKKLATWKKDKTENISEASLMEEYMQSYYSGSNRGNLYLNALEYSAIYFKMDTYKALLPIPAAEVSRNPNMIQNPGY